MDNAVVSDHLKMLIADRRVKAAVFTTFNFEPDFFELEVIPLLLPGNTQLSSHPAIKQFQVREALRDSGLLLEVFYDLKISRENPGCSPAMEYPFHGVHRGNNAFHPKLLFLLVYDKISCEDRLLVGAGSNNLTQAGWWDNIEGIHWREVGAKDADPYFIKRLREDVEWLEEQRNLMINDETSALDLLLQFLRHPKARTGTRGLKKFGAYYGINQSAKPRGFRSFLKNAVKDKLGNFSNWTLEIISPYFAEDAHNSLHEQFLDLGVREIHILLPINQENMPICNPEYFNHIDAQPNVHWAQWSEPVSHNLGLGGQHFRRLHAKLFHFYNKKQSWIFVGSVNFTHKAFLGNIEAGFFVKQKNKNPLLEVIDDSDSFDHFELPSDTPPGEENEETRSLPVIDLLYDWQTQTLTGMTEPYKRYCINIHNPEGGLAIENWAVTGTPGKYQGDMVSLKALLKNGSLVKVSGVNQRSNEKIAAHWIIMKQAGWTHKPLELPEMTPEQILAIYAEMSPERRQLLLMNAQIRKLVLAGLGEDMTIAGNEPQAEGFFSEYAELFHAFRQLRRKMDEALSADNQNLVEYYLTGKGVDSLPTLLENIRDNADISRVTAYLILLCAKEIYLSESFKDYFGVSNRLQKVESAIKQIKEAGWIILDKEKPEDRAQFLNWFEEQFFRVYRKKAATE
ncbi:MAG: phospholipase D family protein [Gammaproteobacteria bacterium]|nr:phospholipase D family protein [Gammaproteobacteria bacterium]